MGMIAYLLTSYGNVKFLKCALTASLVRRSFSAATAPAEVAL